MIRAILLIDHGSRREPANQKLQELAQRLATLRGPDAIVEHCHMELSPPDIAGGVARCVERGATHVVAVPCMLSRGRHMTESIPRLLAAAAEAHPGVTFSVAEPLSEQTGFLDLLSAAADETAQPPAASPRYDSLPAGWFRRCGASGLMLPAISLGFWHNFGGVGTDAAGTQSETALHDNARGMMRAAFELGVTHFDLANNYGPPPGSAEERVGRILRQDFKAHRDELVISTKAGYRMWPGPYGEWGSRKYLLASLDASLRRMQLDYVDIFYSHRPDPNTPLEETLAALDQAVRSGKALYAGISNYSGEMTARAAALCERHGYARLLVHQPSYSMLNRWIEPDLLPVTERLGMGVVCFSPLAQGQLSDKYLAGIPAKSRAGSAAGFLRPEHIDEATLAKVRRLGELARQRDQSLAQMALSWVLRSGGVTSALIGASTPAQIRENVQAAERTDFTADELSRIDAVLGDP